MLRDDERRGVMNKQDQSDSSQSNQVTKQSQSTQQGSHKEKALENQQNPVSQFVQEIKDQSNRKNKSLQSSNKPHDFDRNEGEGRSQKF